MPPRPLPPWSTTVDRPVVIGVVVADAETSGRSAARSARALVNAGADGVEIDTAPGFDPATARCSPAELVAAVAEERIPVGLRATTAVAIHLAVGAGAAWLRVGLAEVDPALAEALSGAGRPCVVAVDTTADALESVVDGGVAQVRAAGLADDAPLLVEVAARRVVDLGSAALRSGRDASSPAGGCTRPDTALPAVADLTTVDGGAAPTGDEAAAGALAAATTMAVAAGFGVVRTFDPRTVRRAAHVADAIEAAR